MDKADLFNVKAERRNQRIKEIFDERINDIREATASMDETVVAALKSHALESRKILSNFSEAFAVGDYDLANKETMSFAKFMKIDLDYASSEDFRKKQSNGTINWDN